jgi:hypothetical protein
MDIHAALVTLRPKSSFVQRGPDYTGLEWADGNSEKKPTESEIQAKIAELQAAEPMRLLRVERNRLLAETDWWATLDRADLITMDQKIYRQELRELPAGLDTVDKVNAVIWPKKPE